MVEIYFGRHFPYQNMPSIDEYKSRFYRSNSIKETIFSVLQIPILFEV
jgi:hypothetical protein